MVEGASLVKSSKGHFFRFEEMCLQSRQKSRDRKASMGRGSPSIECEAGQRAGLSSSAAIRRLM
jgi:hypothetical protein